MTVAYKSTHPDVLAHYDSTASAEALNAWRDQVKALISDLGFPGRRFAISSGFDGSHVTGVEHPHDDEIPAGWRRDRKLSEAITPARRTKLGKEIARRLAALPQPNVRRNMPGGMPHIAFGAHTFMRPGVARYGDAVYVTWSNKIDDCDSSEIDPAVWQPVKLSEYYAAREEAEARTARDDADGGA